MTPVTLQRATSDADTLLRNLLELYIHDLNDAYPVELGPDGRHGYDQLTLYWLQPGVRQAFLIKVGGRVAVIRAHTNGVLLERVQPARNSRWHVFRFVSSADVSLHERHSPS